MKRCVNCCQEYTAVDFVALRNLCEHVYLDSLAQKWNPSLSRSSEPFPSLRTLPPVRESLDDLVAVEQ
jgi:hypothetical protein